MKEGKRWQLPWRIKFDVYILQEFALNHLNQLILSIKTELKKIPWVYDLVLQRRERKRRSVSVVLRTVSGVYGRVHPNDFMINGDSDEAVAVYNRIGNEALKFIQKGLDLTSCIYETIGFWLDLDQPRSCG